MLDNPIEKSCCPLAPLPDDWIIFSQIWFKTCRHFKLTISHHALAVAMYKADEGKQSWETYLTRSIVECQRQWDLDDTKVQAHMAHHIRLGVVFQPIETGWEIRVHDTYIWQWQSLKSLAYRTQSPHCLVLRS